MPTSFRPYRPEQNLLLPPSPREWLPAEHLAHFICDTIDQMRLARFYQPYQGDGRRNQPFEPQMMVKVLLYAYATGTFSSRRIAQKIEEDIAFRYLAAGNFPKHRTIADFRKNNLEAFIELFGELVRIARESGLIRLGTVAIDGTKIRANASRKKTMTYKKLKKERRRLEEEIAERLDRAAAEDEAEDGEFGADCRGDELPEELRDRQTRLRKIREAIERVEQQQEEEDRVAGRYKTGRPGRKPKRKAGVPPDDKSENLTDSDSRVIKTNEGFQQAYNPQIAVDEESHLIVAADVTNSASDRKQLIPMVDEIERVTGQKPGSVLADTGYRSEANFQELEKREIEGLISLAGNFYDPAKTGNFHPSSATQRMKERLQSADGLKKYKKRKWIVEPIAGWIKRIFGFRQFSLRGLENVKGEWSIICLAVDLKRMRTLAVA